MQYLSERQLFAWKMGRVMTDEEILAITPKRDRVGRIDRLNNSPNLYAICDICNRPFLVNQFEDHKPRTPKYKNFVICIMCDPRHLDDRYMKTGYRMIHPAKQRIVAMAMIARALATRRCSKPERSFFCKCPECVAGKLFPPF